MAIQNKLLQAAAGAGGDAGDDNFNQTTLLLHGDGTNGAQNNTFLDSSSNSNTLTRTGNPTQGTFSPFGDRWSNYFDGTGDNVSVSDSTAFDFATGDFTIECWAYIIAQSSDFTMIGSFTGTNNYWGFGAVGDGGMTLYNGTTDIYSGSSATPPLNQWNHLVWQRVSGVASMYLNGERVYNASYSGTWGTSQTGAKIGRSDDYSNYYANGYISDYRIVKGAGVYSGASFTPPTEPLTAITNTELLTCQSNRFKDNSSNDFAITVSGDTKVTKFSPYAPTAAYNPAVDGGSGYFEGDDNSDYLATSSAIIPASSNFTVEGWVYCTEDNATQVVCSQYNGGAGRFLISTDNANMKFFQNGVTAYESTNKEALNQWCHFVAMRTGSNTAFYVNGVRAFNLGAASMEQVAFEIGNESNLGSYGHHGYISSLRVTTSAVYSEGSTITVPTAPYEDITNTELLCNFTNAGIFDSTGRNNLETVGNAQIDTAVKQFGTGSMEFDGSGDALVTPANPDLSFGTGDFTVEFWVYFDAVNNSTVKYLFDFRNASQTSGSFLAQESSDAWLYHNGANSGIATGFTSSTFATSTWYHVAISRSSSTTKFFVDGTQTASTADASNYANDTLTIASRYTTANALDGYIDDFRITKGVARYTAAFTPPDKAFPDQ